MDIIALVKKKIKSKCSTFVISNKVSNFFFQERPIPKNYTAGESARLVYKARTRDLFLVALKFGQWTWNKSVIVPDNDFVIGNITEKRKFWLKIKKVDISNSGLYSFMINGTAVQRWQLYVHIVEGKYHLLATF